jgi:hypothetical protein
MSQLAGYLACHTAANEEGLATSEHEPGDERHRHESPLLHEQEHKGYGADEGEREELLEREEDDEPETAD